MSERTYELVECTRKMAGNYVKLCRALVIFVFKNSSIKWLPLDFDDDRTISRELIGLYQPASPTH